MAEVSRRSTRPAVRAAGNEPRHPSPVPSVARAVDILLVLSRGSRQLGAIAEEVGLAKGTVHRLLKALAHRELVVQDPRTNSYMLGVGCFDLVDGVVHGRVALVSLARPIMRTLADKTLETVALNTRFGLDRVCIAEVPSVHPLRYVVGVGSTRPLYVGAGSKCLLAFTDDQQRASLIQSMRLVRLTKATITDPAQLESDLAGIRRQGWALSRGESTEGGFSIAAPVFAGGACVASLLLGAPEMRVRDTAIPKLRKLVVASAVELSALITDLGSNAI